MDYHSWKKVFAIIWSGQFVSIMSSTIVGFAVVLWLSIETGSAEVLAFATIAHLLPHALVSPFAGVYVDRWSRKWTMIGSDAFISVCTLALAFMFFLGYTNILYMYILLLLRSLGSAFHSPAMQASVPLLAPKEHLVRIAGINQMIQSIAAIAGPVVAAILIQTMDIAYIMLIDIGGAIVACVTLLFVTIPNPAKKAKDEQHFIREMKEGFTTVINQSGINYLFLFSIIIMICVVPIGSLFPLMTLNHFEGTPLQVGYVEVAWGTGMLIGGAFIGTYKRPFKKVTTINFMHIIGGLTFLTSGLLTKDGYIIFLIVTWLGGITYPVYNACFTSLIQETIAPEKLGRVFSMFISASMFPSLIGLLFAGFVADIIGLPATFAILGSAMVITGFVSFLVPSMMALDKRR